MRNFKYIDDIEDWLEPMEYLGFWAAISPYDLMLQPRAHCDDQIARGAVDTETVLAVLKHMARTELTRHYGLRWKAPTPWVKLVNNH